VGTSMMTLRLCGGSSPVGIKSISMARALVARARYCEAAIATQGKKAQIDFDKVRRNDAG
ncbi:MAG: hypothetical protein ACXU6Y_11775, partial [Croceibacterium sp.]